MVTISAFVAEPSWLRTAGQIAGTLLLVELLIALAVVCALMGGLAYAAWWLHRNVIPVVDQYGQQAQQVMSVAERSGERIVERVATFHGAQVGVLTGLRVFLFGRPKAESAGEAPNASSASATREQTASAATSVES